MAKRVQFSVLVDLRRRPKCVDNVVSSDSSRTCVSYCGIFAVPCRRPFIPRPSHRR